MIDQMTTIYVVTSGEYSDYRIEAIYDNQAAADEHVERVKALSRYVDCGVEEYELFSDLRAQTMLYTVRSTIGADGELVSSSESDHLVYADEAPRSVREHVGPMPGGRVMVRTEGVDGDQVRKSHAEKVARVRGGATA